MRHRDSVLATHERADPEGARPEDPGLGEQSRHHHPSQLTAGDPNDLIHTMKPGRYLRTWGGYTIPVTVRFLGGLLVAIMPSGFHEPVSHTPDATWAPVGEDGK